MTEPIIDLDPEVMLLVEVINQFLGIRTRCSCCGHGTEPFRIWFRAAAIDVLPPLLYWFDVCHCGFGGWRIYVQTDCAMSPPSFCIEGPIGEQAYQEADAIAALLREYLREYVWTPEGGP